jgi:hypothetical protein
MKQISFLALMFALAFGSSFAPTKTRAVANSGVSAIPEDIEGVIMYDLRSAALKPGYAFRRESRSSVAVWKNTRDATMQMGTLTCTKPRKGACTVEFDQDRAKCSGQCYFVGVRGGTRAN